MNSEPCVEITVVDVKGSAPREPGSVMRWLPNGKIEGTIGGGNLEQKSLEEADRLWNDPNLKTAFLEFPLSAALGQCCGGYVRVFLAKRLPPREVLICGAGHVSTALAGILAETPLRVTIVDPRKEWSSPERFPKQIQAVADDPEAFLREWSDRAQHTYLLIMTHDHPTDQALCQLALRYPFLWIGLIGSRAKWSRFRSRMAAKGFTADELARIVSPIGDPKLGKSPQEIAVGVAAQLLGLYHGQTPRIQVQSAERSPGPRAALILAGGASRRMGRWKGGLDFKGEPLILAHAKNYADAGAETWKGVFPEAVREEAEKIIPPGHRIINPDPSAPMFASLQLGLRALIQEHADLDSLLVAPVDMTPLDEPWISALWDRHEATSAWITRPVLSAHETAEPPRHGHPIILDQRMFALILAADPRTARLDHLVRDLPENFKAVLEIADSAALSNLNTPEDYADALG